MKKETTTNHRITVQLLGSGYAAVELCDVIVHEPDGTQRPAYTDVQQTGIGRYKTYDQALIEARQWSRSNAIPLSVSDRG